ncbi:hypothetical protein BGX26_010470 [Mortierella sp. AD094]|nr:hypothetical protein BGX26_010470 [Mortierella sp. AD094]
MAMAKLQEQMAGAGHSEEDVQVMHESITQVKESGVEPANEDEIHEAKAAHEKVYKQGNTDDASDEELGKAAGVQAFHEYKKAQAEDEEEGGEGGGGQAQLLQMAMAEGMKMFSGGGGQDKGAVIQSAIAMAMKLFMSQSGEGGGISQLMGMLGGGSGGGGGAMSLLQKFM